MQQWEAFFIFLSLFAVLGCTHVHARGLLLCVAVVVPEFTFSKTEGNILGAVDDVVVEVIAVVCCWTWRLASGRGLLLLRLTLSGERTTVWYWLKADLSHRNPDSSKYTTKSHIRIE